MDVGVDLVIFGASGDLAQRKILPSLGRLVAREGQHVRVVGAGRSGKATDEFRQLVREGSGNEQLAAAAEWVKLDYATPATFAPLKELLTGSPCVIFYLATPPETFSDIVVSIVESGLAAKQDASRRIVVEKPLGHDLASAQKLNAQLAEAFDEEQIFRIDHYLAKDTVQNVLALRFSNSLFEPVWNRTLVESILITVAEEEGIGQRAGYYDQTGAVRDIIQNHALQLLALITMEPPTTFDAEYVRRAKRAALRAMLPIDPSTAVRGQYDGYQEEEGVAPDSRRETYVAARVAIENWRWDGVPIFVRTGKALKRRVTEVVIKLRDAPRAANRRPPPARDPNFDRHPNPAGRGDLASHRRQAPRHSVRDGAGRDAARLRPADEVRAAGCLRERAVGGSRRRAFGLPWCGRDRALMGDRRPADRRVGGGRTSRDLSSRFVGAARGG